MIPELENLVKESDFKAGSKFVLVETRLALNTLIETLEKAEERYKSYLGFSHAYEFLKTYNHPDPISAASGIAVCMSKMADKMANKMKEIKDSFEEESNIESVPSLIEDLRRFICNDFYNDSFVFTVEELINDGRCRTAIIEEIAYEATRVDFCTVVRSSIESQCNYIMNNYDGIMETIR